MKLNVAGMNTGFPKGLVYVWWYAYDIQTVRREISGSRDGEIKDNSSGTVRNVVS